MAIPRTVAEVLNDHVTFSLEGIDRMDLNLYVPRLQCEKGVAHFWRFHRGHRFASSALMDPMTKDFVHRLERFALEHAIPVVTFQKDQRKDEVAQRFFASSKIEEGVVVIPSLHVDYKKSRIKQYHKEGQALRTETTIHDTRDVGVGKSLKNLPALRRIGFQANRRLLDVQKITQDCALGEDALRHVTEPVVVDDQRAAGLRYGHPRVQALMSALLGFALQACGFTSRELRQRLAPLLGLPPDTLSQGRITYDLRRLRLHGLIERIPRSHRYRLTRRGIITAVFFTRSYARVLRSGCAQIYPAAWAGGTRLRRAFEATLNGIDDFVADAKLTS